MKNLYLLLLALLPTSVMAQNKIAYSYDEAGNRVKREIVMTVQKSRSKNAMSDSSYYSDMVNSHSIKIYPNPTEGRLNISINADMTKSSCKLEIYSILGARILVQNIASDNTAIDISNQPNGIYLLSITINKETTTWKIIKK
jgi:hypothetical protein